MIVCLYWAADRKSRIMGLGADADQSWFGLGGCCPPWSMIAASEIIEKVGEEDADPDNVTILGLKEISLFMKKCLMNSFNRKLKGNIK